MKTGEDILRLIEEEDVEFVRLQFTDMFGNLKNVAVTPGQMEKVLNGRFCFGGSALFDDLYDYPNELYLVPDPDTFVILPWRPQQGKVGKMICDVVTRDGKLCDLSSRTLLKKIIKEAEALGYTFKINPECEFFLFHTDDYGVPTTVSHERAGYLDVGPVDFGENARRDMVLTLEEMGFEIESSHHEKAPAQHEIDFAEADTLTTADQIMTFRFAVRSIAKRFGLYATFIPKPRTDCAGSGMHLNISMYKDGKNVFDSGKEGVISDIARYFMGGVMAHAQGMCIFTNPIVNSYKRIGSGFEAPDIIDWSTANGKHAIRLAEEFDGTKVELRFPDSAANPYLVMALCIKAGLDGIEKKISPDAFSGRNTKKLANNLDQALKFLHKDKLIFETLGDEFVKIYADAKAVEWKEYMTQVSDWELEKYLVKM